MSYTAILGGTITLIGTSTNLIVNGFAVDAGMAPLGFFDFTLVGLGALSVGLITILVMLKCLPDNGKNSQEVVPFYLEGKVQSGSKLINRTVEENGLRDLKDLFLAEIIRDGNRICAVTPQHIIQQDDILLFVGDIKSVPLLTRFDGLKVVHDKHEKDIEHLVEVVELGLKRKSCSVLLGISPRSNDKTYPGQMDSQPRLESRQDRASR